MALFDNQNAQDIWSDLTSDEPGKEKTILNSVKDPDGILSASALIASALGGGLLLKGLGRGKAATAAGGGGGGLMKVLSTAKAHPIPSLLAALGFGTMAIPVGEMAYEHFLPESVTHSKEKKRKEKLEDMKLERDFAEESQVRQAEAAKKAMKELMNDPEGTYQTQLREQRAQKAADLLMQEVAVRGDAASQFRERYAAAKSQQVQTIGQLIGMI